MITKIRKDKSKFFSQDPKTKRYSALSTLKSHALVPGRPRTYTEFLKEIGINFTERELRSKRITKTDLAKFRASVEGIKDSLSRIGPPIVVNKERVDTSIRYLSEKTFNIAKQLRELSEVKAKLNKTVFESTHFNINNEKTQSYLGSNIVSNLHDVLMKAKNLKDFRDTQFSYLESDVFSESSLLIKSLFDVNNKQVKIADKEYVLTSVFIDGLVNNKTGKKTEASKFSKKQRFVMEMNLNDEGIYATLVPGDASIEHFIRLHAAKQAFVTQEMYDNKSHLEIFKNYLLDEAKHQNIKLSAGFM